MKTGPLDKFPLRKVIKSKPLVAGLRVYTLECGHTVTGLLPREQTRCYSCPKEAR